MEQTLHFVQQTDIPLLAAFLLGLLVAVHPCPMATNIAALSYLAKGSVAAPSRLFARGMLYVLGRTLAFVLLGVLLIALVQGGLDLMGLGIKLGEWGEQILAPLLVVIGLYLLYNDLLHHHDHVPSEAPVARRLHGAWGSLLLGMLFAMAFCPESGIVYFGMIVPMSVERGFPMGCLFPLAFAVGMALPVILLSWVFAYSVESVARVSRGMRVLKAWTTRIVAVVFIVVGVLVWLV